MKKDIIKILLFLLVGISTNFIIYPQGQSDNKVFDYLKNVVKDYDGNIYHTIKIGSQTWMLENLKVTHYRDGTPIPNLFENDRWTNAEDGAYCMVNNDSITYKNTFGLLYNFYAVVNKKGLAPEGWHIPTEKECLQLINYLGGKEVAGKKIKAHRPDLWNVENLEATNESGFTGLPAGGRGRFGEPGDVGSYATWWSSTSYDSLYAWHWGLYPQKTGIRSNPGHKSSGFSVRCVKD